MKSAPNDLLTLVSHLPVLTREHVVELLGSDSKATAWIRRVQRHKLITVGIEPVHRRKIDGPIETVRPGQPLPDAGPLAYRAGTLWTGEWSPRIIIRGTIQLALLSGTEPITAIAAQVSHDLALTDVLLRKRRENPDFEWKLVAPRPGFGTQPDAISVDGTIQVEILGRYNRKSTASKLMLGAKATLELW